MSSSQSQPAFALFPDLKAVIRTGGGCEYRGKFRQHDSTKQAGEWWFEGYVQAQDKDHIHADTVLQDRFNKEGQHPDHFHPQSRAEPVRIKLNRIPVEQRNDKNEQTYMGELWNHEGLWTIICSPSKSDKLIMAGNVVPSRQELDYAGSNISRYQPQADKAGTVTPA